MEKMFSEYVGGFCKSFPFCEASTRSRKIKSVEYIVLYNAKKILLAKNIIINLTEGLIYKVLFIPDSKTKTFGGTLTVLS